MLKLILFHSMPLPVPIPADESWPPVHPHTPAVLSWANRAATIKILKTLRSNAYQNDVIYCVGITKNDHRIHSPSIIVTMIAGGQNWDFAEELEQIQQRYISTKYGNIFAHTVGSHGQPLILVVHGSGPKNSADEYLYFLHEYLVRVSYIEKFYIVAIDCPGYGRSKGSKEAVKTFPRQMFREILLGLGYKSYFAMLGHSQGGAAIFNACYDDRALAQFLLMDRPVCGNIKRFSKFPTPTLLVYDIEDDGHPIWQGKLLFKQLPCSQLHTYRNSQDTYWVPDHLWDLILEFTSKYVKPRASRTQASRLLLDRQPRSHDSKIHERARSTQKPSSIEKSEGVSRRFSLIKEESSRKQEERAAELRQISEVDRSEIHSRVADLEQLEELPGWLNQPKVEQTEQEAKLQQVHLQGLIHKIRSQVVAQQQMSEVNTPATQQKKQQPTLQQVAHIQDEQRAKISAEDNQYFCSICHEQFYHPLETNCKHVFCRRCLEESLLVDPRCPLCRAQVLKKTPRPDLSSIVEGRNTKEWLSNRQNQLAQFDRILKSIVYVEIGNTSYEIETKKSIFTKTKRKFQWQLFVKEPKNFKLQQVSFNINMGEPNAKPVRVLQAPFVFESRGTFSFSCEISIKPKNKDYAPLTSIYRINVEPGTHTKTIALRPSKA